MDKEVMLYKERPENNSGLLPEKSQDLGLVFRNMFGIVDFDPLFNSVKTIAESTKELSEDEGKAARNTLSEWENSVIRTIQNRREFMRNFIRLFTEPVFDEREFSIDRFGMTEEMAEKLSETTGTLVEYGHFMSARKDVIDLKNNAPERPDMDDPDVSKSALAEAVMVYNLESERHKTELLRKRRTAQKAFSGWITKMKDHEQIKDMLVVARKYRDTSDNLMSQCRDLSTQGKLAVMVKNENTRNALLNMLAFSRKI